MNLSFSRCLCAFTTLVCSSLALSAFAIRFSGPPAYHLVKKIAIGGTERWDYLTLDSTAHRLYITRSNQIIILNLDTGSATRKLLNTPGVHGVSLAPSLNRGYTSNGAASTSTIFDLKTLKVLGNVKTGANPDAIVYDPFSQRVFTFNGLSNDATVFDARTAVVLGTIPLGGKPEFAVTDGNGQVFVNVEDTNEVLTLDVKRLIVSKRFALNPCAEPTGLSIDQRNHRLFIGCRNQLMAVVDADSGGIVTTLPIGKGVDATTFDPGTDLAFSSNGDGTVTVVHEDSPNRFSVVQTLVTLAGARTMALDPQTHRLFLATARFGSTPVSISSQLSKRHSIIADSFEVLVYGQ